MKSILTLTLIAGIIVASCNSNDASFTSEKEIYSVQETKKLIASDAILIDVREKNEIEEIAYDVKDIKYITLAELASKFASIPKDKQVILVCYSGKRSADAFELLKSKGFTNVASMEGGIVAWEKAGFPVKVSKEACCADPTSENCNPDGTCKTEVVEAKACCSDETSIECCTEGISSKK